jgi:hypothetical protein
MPLIQGSIATLTTTRANDGTATNVTQGRQGELLVSELHGKQYTSNLNGYVWHASVSGVTVPVNAASLASVFSIINPVGSNRTAELIRLDVGSVLATTVVGHVGLVQQSVRGGAVLPTTCTAGVQQSGLVGGSGSSAMVFCTAATHIGTPTVLAGSLATFGAVTTTAANTISYDFDGTIILAPGSIISVVMSTAPSTASGLSLHAVWSEGPVNA